MRILDFYKEYPDELSCRLKFKEIRDQEGIICKNVDVHHITGRRINGVTNVKSVNSLTVLAIVIILLE